MTTWTRDARYTPLTAATLARYEALCTEVEASPWRQHYHIQPPAGLLNDPNGFSYWQGAYHIFYQWFPLGPVHGLKYWRHLSSTDLVHYTDHGTGIAPDSDWDSHGAYSGSAIADGDELLIAYTGNHREADWTRIPYQLTAHLDTHNHLRKDEPFLKGAPEGYTEHVRDPKIWREADGSYGIILGAQRADLSGTALYLTSKDARDWQLHGEIDTAQPTFGYMWECPDYFPLDGHDILTYCPQGLPADGDNCRNLYQSGYLIGHFDKTACRFTHDGFRELDHGFDYYAPQSSLGANGERLLIAWMGLPDTTCPSARDGWAHCLTLPRVLTVENGQLRQRPHPNLTQLRGSGAHDGVHYEGNCANVRTRTSSNCVAAAHMMACITNSSWITPTTSPSSSPCAPRRGKKPSSPTTAKPSSSTAARAAPCPNPKKTPPAKAATSAASPCATCAACNSIPTPHPSKYSSTTAKRP